MEIRTLGDLRDFVKMLGGFNDNVTLDFSNRFEEFELSSEYKVDLANNIITIPTRLVGNILQGHHRVLGGKE